MFNTPVFKWLCLIFLVWGAMFYSSIASTVAIWLRSETFTHCFIILPICIYLIKLKWPVLKGAKIAPNFWGLLPVMGALVIWLFGDLAKLLVIEQAAAFLMLPLMIWTLMGNKVARLLIFTFVFWMFSVPVGEFLVPQLQNLTADITVWFLQITGVPVYRNGLYIEVPNGLFEVAVACSGIRYLIASFTLGTLFAYLNYHSRKKRIIFILFSLILPLLANGIRAYGIVMIAHMSDMKYATGVDHLVYGWLFFGVVIFVMFTVGSIWSDPVENRSSTAFATSPKTTDNKISLAGGSLILLLFFIVVGYKQLVSNPTSQYSLNVNSIFQVQSPIKDDTWLPSFKRFSLETSGKQNGVDFYLAYYNADNPEQELISSANKLYNIVRWSVVERKAYENFATVAIVDTRGNKRLLAYSYYTDWLTSPVALKIKLSQAIQAFLGQPQTGMVLVLSLAVDDFGKGGEKLIEAAKIQFASKLKDHQHAKV